MYVLSLPVTTGSPSLIEVFSGDAGTILKRKYTAMSAASVSGVGFLVAYNKDGGDADIYRLHDGNPWINYATTISVGAGWDLVEMFILGNQPHLVFYQRSNGTFSIFPLNDQLNSTSHFQYVRNHDPGVTQGFTTVKAFSNHGVVVVLGYDFDSGRVAMYALSVVATSPPGVSPIAASNAWAHLWARGWTRFAFFQLGGENFFLKTNTVWTNVNIDHIMDNPKDGTSEVATHMEKDDPEILSMDLFHAFYLRNGDPHFLAYKSDGATNLYRINSDCQGWTKLSTSNTVSSTERILAVKIGGSQYFVFN
jgi:hypothetical protein